MLDVAVCPSIKSVREERGMEDEDMGGWRDGESC